MLIVLKMWGAVRVGGANLSVNNVGQGFSTSAINIETGQFFGAWGGGDEGGTILCSVGWLVYLLYLLDAYSSFSNHDIKNATFSNVLWVANSVSSAHYN